MQRDGGPGPGGAGGAGNPTGGGFTGPAEALEIIGNHAYAYSGKVTDPGSGSAATTALLFTSGNYYFVGTLATQSDESSANTCYVAAALNDAIIMDWDWDASSSSAQAANWPIPIIIPPYTKVEIKVGAGDSVVWTAQLVGRIYRG